MFASCSFKTIYFLFDFYIYILSITCGAHDGNFEI